MSRSVIVVGGGVAGLVAARELALGGSHVELLEASDRVGGALRSEVLGNVSVDVGAEAFGVTRPETARLIDELGLGDRVVSPRRADARLLLDNGLHAMPHAMLGVPTDLASAQVVDVIGVEESRAALARDAAPLGPLPPTLGALVRQRMGDAVADRILTPVVAGVHAADPDIVETDAVIPGLTAALAETGSLAAAAARLRSTSGAPGSALAGLDGGMTTLVRRLADEARARGVRIRAGVVVTGAVRGNDEWIVSTSEGSLRSDDLVLAVAAPVGAALLGPSSEVSVALSRLAVGDVVVCAAVLDAPELDDDPVGSGLLVAPGNERVRAKALTHATAKWQWIRDAYGPGTHLVRLSYGRNGRVEELPDELPGIVRSDLAAILAIDRPVIRDLLVTRWSQSLVLPTVGHRAAVAAVRAEVEAAPGLAVVGAGLGGNGLAGTIAVARGVREQLDRR